MTDVSELTPAGQRLEAQAHLANVRTALLHTHDGLDLNSPEANEIARICTEIRRSLERLEGG